MSTDFPNDDEYQRLINIYEEARNEGRNIYLDLDDFCYIANYYMQELRIDESIEAVEKALAIHSDDLRLIALRITLYLFENKGEQAWQTLNAIKEQESPIVKISKVEVLIHEGRKEEAWQVLQTVSFESVKDEGEVVLSALYSYYDLELYEDGLKWLGDKIPQNLLDNNETAEFIAGCYEACGRYKEAIELYNRLLDEVPYSATYWLGLAKALLNDLQYEKAAEACDFALTIDENLKEAHTIKAHMHFQLEDYESAIKEFEKSEGDPMYNNTFIALSYINMEDYEKGYELLDKVIFTFDQESPVYPYALENYGKSLYRTGRMQDATRCYEDLYSRFPDFHDGHLTFAEILINQERVKEAFDHFLKALEVENSEEVWYEMGLITFNGEYYQDALPLFKKVEEMNPEYKHVIKYLAISYYYVDDTANFQIYKEKVLKDFIGFDNPDDLNDPKKELDIVNTLHCFLDSELMSNMSQK